MTIPFYELDRISFVWDQQAGGGQQAKGCESTASHRFVDLSYYFDFLEEVAPAQGSGSIALDVWEEAFTLEG